MARVTHSSPAREPGPVRLAILDDNPFIRDHGGVVHPAAALFSRFAAAVVAEGSLAPAAYLAPVRDQGPDDPAPSLAPIDGAHLRLVPTAPFQGIAGYLRSSPSLTRRNWPVIRDALAAADLLWIKAPASNAALAVLAARRAGVPRFVWVAGSVRDVVDARDRGPLDRFASGAVGVVYDATTRLMERTGPSIRLGAELFTSVITDADVAATSRIAPVRPDATVRLAWAGRMAGEKGLDDLISAVELVAAGGTTVSLALIGDGPARAATEAHVARSAVAGAVDVVGFIGDRSDYLAALRAADLFILPSRAEGVPKVLVEAMAAGLPIVATRVGAVPAVLGEGARGTLVDPGDPTAMAAAIAHLAADPVARQSLREAGLDYAATHTVDAQARRLLGWLADTFPALPWRSQ